MDISITPVLPIAARYLRSVHLQRDYARRDAALRGYLCTPLVLQTIERIVTDTQQSLANHSFSVIGPYGVGKSAFGLFLAHYMVSSGEQRLDLLQRHGIGEIPNAAVLRAPRLHPVVLSGNNEPLRLALLRALALSLQSPMRRPPLELQECIDTLLNRSNDTEIDPQSVAQLYQQASDIVRRLELADGLLLIIDELGQYLDYSAHAKDTRDLYVLQALAESAAGREPVSLLIVTILHQAFDRYAGSAGEARRIEWNKVQGRYIDLPFSEPTSQVLRMIGRVLHGRGRGKRDSLKHLRTAWADEMAALTDEHLQLRPTDISSDEWHELLAHTYPLHPTVLIVLPTLFRQLAQNERSLFAFLAGNEPHSVQDVVSQRGNQDPVYRLTDLYAYVEAAMGVSLFTHARGKRWAELAEALTSSQDMPDFQRQVLITIGTLNALGQQKPLRANQSYIAFALYDQLDHPDVVAALTHLSDQKQIVYRRYRDTYLIWEGSDYDIDLGLQHARQQISQQRDLAALLQKYSQTPPLVARRHSYETGAVRHFVVQYVDPDQLAQREFLPTPIRDGLILHIVATDDEALARAEEWLHSNERSGQLGIVAVIPRARVVLYDMLLDVAALQWMLQNTPELSNDAVAQREVASRLLEAQQTLEAEQVLAYGPSGGRWFWAGVEQRVENMSDVDRLLSQVCDVVFDQTPRIWNELIVRRQISSAAAKARRNLIQAMLEHAHEPLLGITDYSPERSIYESVLRQSGLHREDEDGRWRFGAPLPTAEHLHLRPAWEAIEQFFALAEEETRPLSELFKQLEAPPFGVKAGLHPILFTAAYLAAAGEVALYEHGSYLIQPDIAVFERLLRQPDYFSVRRSRVTGMRALVYRRLARTFAPELLERTDHVSLLDAVNPLLRIAHRWPDYTKTTQRVTLVAQEIRAVLLAAWSPEELLFTRLPIACSIPAFEPDAEQDFVREDQFFSVLREGLTELHEAYDHLLQDITYRLATAFKLNTVLLPEPRTQLVQRWKTIEQVTDHNELRAFGLRLMSDATDKGWLEQVAEIVVRKPPKNWRDSDLGTFSARLNVLAQQFQEFEILAVHQNGDTQNPGQLLRISLTQNGVGDLWTVVHRNGQQTEKTEQLKEALQRLLVKADADLTPEQQLLVVADLLQPLLRRTTEENSDA